MYAHQTLSRGPTSDVATVVTAAHLTVVLSERQGAGMPLQGATLILPAVDTGDVANTVMQSTAIINTR